MKRNGFTLIELLVTISILGIMASIAIPSFSRWYPNYRLRSAATDIHSSMHLAKLQAVKDNGECAVVFDSGNEKYEVISGGADKDYSTAGDNVTIKTVDFLDYDDNGSVGYGRSTGSTPLDADRGFDNNITFSNSGDGADIVVFNSRGMINGQPNSAGEVYVRNSSDTSYVVGVSAGASILLRKWMGGTWE